MNAQTDIAPSLMSALPDALSSVDGAKKNSTANYGKYADLSAVISAIRPALEHGVWYRQVVHENPQGAEVETLYIGHGDELSAGRVFVPAGKSNAHAFGSALTYARRYGLQTAFGLAVEDDDGNAANQSPPQQQQAKMPDDVYAKLVQLVANTNTNVTTMFGALGINRDKLDQLSRDEAVRVENALNAKLAKMAKAETNSKAEKVDA